MSRPHLTPAPPIVCTAPAGVAHPCGVLGVEQIAAAAAAGLCCREWLARTTDAGEVDWFTRPTIPSYHSVWFELHENLLATLGIDRAQEASGRPDAP